MWKKIAIAGAVGAAILGSGAAALAASGSSGTTPGTGSPAAATSTAGAAGKGKLGHLGKLARRLEHGEIVTHGKNGDVTHDIVLGKVTAVSPTSITVQATDGFSEQFAVTSTTKVNLRTSGKATKSAIGDVKVGDEALVVGTKSGSAVTATRIADRPA